MGCRSEEEGGKKVADRIVQYDAYSFDYSSRELKEFTKFPNRILYSGPKKRKKILIQKIYRIYQKTLLL